MGLTRKAAVIDKTAWYVCCESFVTDNLSAAAVGERVLGATIAQHGWPPEFFVSEDEARSDPDGEDAHIARRRFEIRQRTTA